MCVWVSQRTRGWDLLRTQMQVTGTCLTHKKRQFYSGLQARKMATVQTV